ncbi:MAG TPA: hypothetical protein PKW95_09990 [bacterium]|nr:hypothetical protein [bacterium]
MKHGWIIFSLALLIILATLSACSDDEREEDEDEDYGRSVENQADSGCLNFPATFNEDGTFNEDFVLQWDGAGTIAVYHGHTCNNCGFRLAARYRVDGAEIAVTEATAEGAAEAFCSCLFEFNYELVDIQPGEYTLRMVSQNFDKEPAERFKLDLALIDGEPDEFTVHQSEGSVCD